MFAWGAGFWMWRLTLARRVLLVLMSAEYSVVMCGAWPGTLVTWPWLRRSMMYCCALRFWSQICFRCQSYWFPDLVTLHCCVGTKCPEPKGWPHTYEMVTEHFAQLKFKCNCCEKYRFLGFVVWDRTFVFSLYRNPDLDGRFFDCLLTSTAAVHAEDVCASFLFVGDLNGHHQEWLGQCCSLWLRNCIWFS